MVWDTLPETNIAPEDGWLEDYFSFGMASWQVQTVGFREGIQKTSKSMNDMVHGTNM